MTGFPFSAIVGNDDYKTALLANAVDPSIGGVLACGERGTAKTTVARAVAALLPDRAVAAGCGFSCDPGEPFRDCPSGPHDDHESERRPARLVELPVGATLDRLVGTFDVAEALGSGEMRFQPGLLATANRNILYVDEVNLLADHLVDALLDAAACGVNRVERDGISVTHAARFVLVGTMNPEEGELRPQFLDRFGLCVDIAASRDARDRATIVSRRLEFDRDPETFAAAYLDADAKLRGRVDRAQQAVRELSLSEHQLESIATACAELGAAGLRGDIVTARTACALAALDVSEAVTDTHVRQALMLALPHRVRDPFREEQSDALQRIAATAAALFTASSGERSAPAEVGTAREDPLQEAFGAIAPRASVSPALPETPQKRRSSGAPGRARRAAEGSGGRVDSRPHGEAASQLDIPATVGAAARRHAAAAGEGTARIAVEDLREAILRGRDACLVILAVDTSGSVFEQLGRGQMEQCLGALVADTAQRRDRLAVVAFGGGEARLLTPPTRNHSAALGLLAQVEPGGTTPLASALAIVNDLTEREQRRHPGQRVIAIVLTDGRANVAKDGGDPLSEAHRQAVELAGRATENYVIADNGWHAERLATRAGATLVHPLGIAGFAGRSGSGLGTGSGSTAEWYAGGDSRRAASA